jgi:arginine repressor
MDVTDRPDMVSTMYYDETALERAFQLARSGDHRSIDEIKRRLRTEGYSDAQITGATLSRQLRELIRSARNAKAASGTPI